MSVDLCEMVVFEMRKLGYSESLISLITSNVCFTEALGKTPDIQKVHLTRLFHRVMMTANESVPSNVRLALSLAPEWQGWSEDIKLTILPFIHFNQDKFFLKPIPNF